MDSLTSHHFFKASPPKTETGQLDFFQLGELGNIGLSPIILASLVVKLS